MTPNAIYTCIGKGGLYEYLGLSNGAGISKGEAREVYRCTATGRVFHRECSDFSARMEPVAKSAPAEPVSREAVDVFNFDHELYGQISNGWPEDAIELIDSIPPEPLMTVAQHNRIVAALTAPPSPDAELVALMRDASLLIDLLRSEKTIRGDGNPPGLTIAKCEGVLDRIDAKLASLK